MGNRIPAVKAVVVHHAFSKVSNCVNFFIRLVQEYIDASEPGPVTAILKVRRILRNMDQDYVGMYVHMLHKCNNIYF
jgi:hypothetical protein